MNIEIKISKKPVEYTKAITLLEERLVDVKDSPKQKLQNIDAVVS